MDIEAKLEIYLLKYIRHELTPVEVEELEDMLRNHKTDRDLLVKCLSVYKNQRQIEFLRSRDQEKVWQLLGQRRARMKRLELRRWVAYAAAVVLLLCAGIFGYLYQNSADLMIAENLPAKGKVILKLAGGQTVVLGEEQRVIGEDGEVVIKDSSTHLSYQRLTSNSNKIEYNELIIPRGAAYSLDLADGTKVWLNSDSYLRFPVVFPKDGREVELTGEAYFEVARDEKRPFTVKVGENRIEVLGTHFNISAYGKEEGIFTTLAEGSVRVKTSNQETVLIPGEQAGMSWEGNDLEVRKVDVTLYTSWHLGVYEFRNAPLTEIADYLMRWYDIEILFQSENIKHKRFTGAFKRDDSLNFTLENLEKISGLRFIGKGVNWAVRE